MKKLSVLLIIGLMLFAAVSCSVEDDAYAAARSLAISQIGGSLMDAQARQPEMAEKLQKAANIGYYYLNLDLESLGVNPYNAIGIGKIGGSAMDACARQPEMFIKLVLSFMNSCEVEIYGEANWKCVTLTKDELSTITEKFSNGELRAIEDEDFRDLVVDCLGDYQCISSQDDQKEVADKDGNVIASNESLAYVVVVENGELNFYTANSCFQVNEGTKGPYTYDEVSKKLQEVYTTLNSDIQDQSNWQNYKFGFIYLEK